MAGLKKRRMEVTVLRGQLGITVVPFPPAFCTTNLYQLPKTDKNQNIAIAFPLIKSYVQSIEALRDLFKKYGLLRSVLCF